MLARGLLLSTGAVVRQGRASCHIRTPAPAPVASLFQQRSSVTRYFSSNNFKGMSPVDVEKQLLGLRRRVGAYYSLGRYKDALDAAVELQIKVEDEMGKDNAIYASALNNVGLMCKLIADNERAVATYTEALHIYESVSGKMSRNYMITLANLGAAYRTYGDCTKGMEKQHLYDRASEALGDVYQHSQDLLGPEHKETLMAANHLASLFRVMKRTDEAEALYRKALDHCTKMHGEWDSLTATLHNNLGLLLKTLERYDGAANHYKMALNIRSKTLGEKHPDTIVAMHNIAEMHLAKGEVAEATEIQNQIIELAGDGEDKELANTEPGAERKDSDSHGGCSHDNQSTASSTSCAKETETTEVAQTSKNISEDTQEVGSSNDGTDEPEPPKKDAAVEEEFYSKNDWLPNATTRRKGRK